MRDEALAQRPAVLELISALGRRPEARRVALGPLGREASRALVRQLLCLRPELATRVEERTAGNPLFAVQLVRDWAWRGLLVGTPEGFDLGPEASPVLPQALGEVWAERVEHLLSTRPGEDRIALQAAAVLGQEVVREEWVALCRRLGVTASRGLLQALEAQLLVRVRPKEGFAFSHGMLRETIEVLAALDGRATTLHQGCAELLEGRGGAAVAERRSRHLRSAGLSAEALTPLLEALHWRVERGESRRALCLVEEAEEVLDALGWPPSEPLWGELAVTRAQLATWSHEESSVEEMLDRIEEDVERYDWAHTRAQVRALRARMAYRQGELSSALCLYQEAGALFTSVGDRDAEAQNHINLSQSYKFLGRFDEAWSHGQEALRLATEANLPARQVGAHHECATVAWRRRELDTTLHHALEGLGVARRLGYRALAAKCLTQLGEVARLRGELDEAIRRYRAALDLFASLDRPLDVLVSRLNLVMIDLERGDFVAMREQLELGWRQQGVDPGHALMSGVDLGLAICHGMEADWRSWDRHFLAARRALARSGFVGPDMARLARRAGEVARQGLHEERATAAFALAEQQLRGLGRDEEADALTDRGPESG